MAPGEARCAGGRSLPCGCSDGPAASNKRPREDALLEAERSHQRRRIELLDKQLDSTLVKARRLACKLENTEHSQEVLERLFAPRPRAHSGLSLPCAEGQR